MQVEVQISNYTLQPQDDGRLIVLDSSSAVTVTLPQPRHPDWMGVAFEVSVSNIGSGAVTISPTSATIDGQSSLVLNQYDGLTLQCDGSNWFSIRGISGSGGGGSGTVTSVALTVPSRQSVTGSPVSTSGTLAIADENQSANEVFAGPSSGSAAPPTFRSLVPADLPVATTSDFGAVKPDGSTITISSGVISAAGGGGGGGSFQYSALPVPPALSSFTWVNQSGASATASQGSLGAILMTLPDKSSLEWSILIQSVPAAPWSAEAFLSGGQYGINNAGDASATGLYLYDGTKLLGIEFLVENDSGSGPFGQIRVERITNVTTDEITVYGPVNTTQNLSGGTYLRWVNDGTTLYAQFSPDGQNWLTFYSESVGAFITPTDAGFGGANVTGGGSPNSQYVSLRGWKIAT